MSEKESKTDLPDSNHFKVLLVDDIFCPKCKYNLRGLEGVDVYCPECGLCCDALELIEIYLHKQLKRTIPYWLQLLAPILASACWLIIEGISNSHQDYPLTKTSFALSAILWAIMLYIPYYTFKSFKGVFYSLLLHLEILTGFISIVSLFILVMECYVTITELNIHNSASISVYLNQWSFTIFIGSIFSCITGFFVMRMIYKYRSRKCIEFYVHNKRSFWKK